MRDDDPLTTSPMDSKLHGHSSHVAVLLSGSIRLESECGIYVIRVVRHLDIGQPHSFSFERISF